MEQQPQLSQNDHDTLIEMRGDLKRVAKDLTDLVGLVKTTHDDHEKRLIDLERWRNEFKITWRIIVGVASFIGALATIGVQAVIAFFHR